MTHRNPYTSIKAAFDRDVDRLGGVVATEAKTRVGKALISRYGSISDQNITTHVPADVLYDVSMEIIRRGGEPETLRILADLVGFKLVPRGEVEATEPGPIMRHMGDITTAIGKLQIEASDAIADGAVDDVERKAIDAAALEIEKEVAELRHDVGAQGNVTPIPAQRKARPKF